MKEKNLTVTEQQALSAAGALFLLLLLYTHIGISRVAAIEHTLLSAGKPEARSEKAVYYNDLSKSLERLRALEPLNADYIVRYADCLLESSGLGGRGNPIAPALEIQDLYTKALVLNPLNFEYHLKLGWFRETRGIKDAQEELIKTIELYPTDYQGYLFLARHFLRHGDFRKGFINIVQSVYYTGGHGPYLERVFGEAALDLNAVAALQFDRDHVAILTIPFREKKLALKEFGFPHVRPRFFTIKVFAPGAVEKIIFDNSGTQYLVKPDVQAPPEGLYQLELDKIFPGAYLDELVLTVSPEGAAEKIQFTQKCYY